MSKSKQLWENKFASQRAWVTWQLSNKLPITFSKARNSYIWAIKEASVTYRTRAQFIATRQLATDTRDRTTFSVDNGQSESNWKTAASSCTNSLRLTVLQETKSRLLRLMSLSNSTSVSWERNSRWLTDRVSLLWKIKRQRKENDVTRNVKKLVVNRLVTGSDPLY